MLGGVSRLPARRVRHAAVLGATVIFGIAAGTVLADRPGGSEPDRRAVLPGLPPGAMPAVHEAAGPPAVPVAASPPPVEATTPATAAPAPPATGTTTASSVAPPTSAAASATMRRRAARVDARPWIASSAPLAASPPVRVEVPAIGVAASIGPLGLNRDGTLEVPTDFARAGWYTGRPTAGEAGPAVIVAHRASRRGPGAFWTLPDLEPGQEIVVSRADGKRIRFTVDRVEQHRKDAFPTEAVYGPTPDVALRLITCGGPFEASLGDHYRDNVIVFARMTGWLA